MAAAHPRNYLLVQEQAALHGLLAQWPQAASLYEDMLARHSAGQPNFDKMPLAKIQYLAGQAHEKAGNHTQALALYAQAAEQPAAGQYALKAQLAAADLEARNHRPDQARRLYQRLLDTAPNSEEARLAKKALNKLGEN